jgi:hypothetical protein
MKDVVLGDNAQPRLNARKKRFAKWSTLEELRRPGPANYVEEHYAPMHGHTFPTREP